MSRDLLVDRERMYRLFEADDGRLRLGVLCGGIAMYEIAFDLSDDEVVQYRSEGKAFLDSLAIEAARDPEKFDSR